MPKIDVSVKKARSLSDSFQNCEQSNNRPLGSNLTQKDDNLDAETVCEGFEKTLIHITQSEIDCQVLESKHISEPCKQIDDEILKVHDEPIKQRRRRLFLDINERILQRQKILKEKINKIEVIPQFIEKHPSSLGCIKKEYVKSSFSKNWTQKLN